VRILLLTGAVLLALMGARVWMRGAPVASAANTYACPMHPEVTLGEPGRCPICQMALTRVNAAAAETGPTEKRELGARGDAHRFAPGVTWLPETAPPTLPSQPGDPPQLGTAQRRTYTEPIIAPATVEAPEALSAILFHDEANGLGDSVRGQFRSSKSPRVAVAVQRVDEAATAWDDATVLVRFRADSSSTASNSDSPRAALRAGETGWLELPGYTRALLVVPESALLRSAQGPYVLVAPSNSAALERRFLRIGRSYKGWVSVSSGLMEGERLVVGGAFFLDADLKGEPPARLLAGAAP
jgi:Heavy metal binding domain